MEFRVLGRDALTNARRGELITSRGVVHTPVFMPVATRAAVRALGLRDIAEIGFDIILSNTYHLYMRPGIGVLEKAGGLHRFMSCELPILTDSGGFQVFSLSALRKLHDHGVEFRSHIDGSRHLFTPRTVLNIQRVIGSDIMMVLDHCAEYPVLEAEARSAVKRTVDWARESYDYWRGRFDTEKQALFAIVQGGVYENLRVECAGRLCEMDFPGFAVGGLSVGEPKELYREMTAVTLSLLPDDKPRYMMGVGSPIEMLDAIECGVDMFDCVMPTRIARNGTLYTSEGRLNIKAARYEEDFSPLDPRCSCYVCRNFSRAYLRHIYRAGEIAALVYNTYHNLYFMKNFMDEIQSAIGSGGFSATSRKWRAAFSGS